MGAYLRGHPEVAEANTDGVIGRGGNRMDRAVIVDEGYESEKDHAENIRCPEPEPKVSNMGVYKCEQVQYLNDISMCWPRMGF